MTIVDCLSCGRQLRLPDDLLGRKVKCPTCGSVFEATAEPAPDRPAVGAATSPAVAIEVDPDDEHDHPPAPQRRRAPVRDDYEPHRGALILSLGIVSILVPLIGVFCGITAWVMAQRDLRLIQSGVMDPGGHGLTQAGWICAIIGTILDTCRVLLCLVYIGFLAAVFSTIPVFHPPPPRPPVRKFEVKANYEESKKAGRIVARVPGHGKQSFANAGAQRGVWAPGRTALRSKAVPNTIAVLRGEGRRSCPYG